MMIMYVYAWPKNSWLHVHACILRQYHHVIWLVYIMLANPNLYILLQDMQCKNAGFGQNLQDNHHDVILF